MKKSAKFLYFNQLVTRLLVILIFIFVSLSIQQAAWASPFGQGEFGANVPFGSATSISISLGGNVSLTLTPNGSNFSANGSSTVTVTSSDVEGYDLYIYSVGNSSLVGGSYSIPASANTTENPLSTNTWGYNTDGSSNYIGLTTSPVLLLSTSGPYITGNSTTVNFGVLTSIVTGEGIYTGNVTYTAIAING
jgi:hypothetical protein